MRIYLSFYLIAVILTSFVLSGCSGGPTVPDTNLTTTNNNRSGASHQCMGFWLVQVDTGTWDVEVHPLRTSQWHFNITGILNSTMGIGASGVPSQADPANGLFVLDISLTHPFGTKTQLSGFDVKGVLVTPGSLDIDGLAFADADEIRLLNADGYTRWWNPSEFTLDGMLGYTEGLLATAPASLLTANINPYKVFADSLDTEADLFVAVGVPLDDDTGRAVFTAGTTNIRRYRIRFPMNPGPMALFGYAIDVAWGAPDPSPPSEVPDDFAIEANQPEPFYIDINPSLNTLYFDADAVGGGVGGGKLALEIDISDWQGIDGGNIFTQINGVAVAAPELFNGWIDADYESQDGTTAIYEVDVSDSVGVTHEGDTLVIVQVESADGSTYKQAGAPGPEDPLISWQVLILDVPDPECVEDGNNSFETAVPIQPGDVISDQICLTSDADDYYSFQIPLGNDIEGTVDLWCDAEPTTVGLYDSSETMLHEETVSASNALLDLTPLNPGPGTYYIKVSTQNDSQVAPYILELGAVFVDVSPSNPIEITPSTLVVKPNRLWLNDDYVYMTSDLGVWVYDIAMPSAPTQVTYLPHIISEEAAFHYPNLYFKERMSDTTARLNLVDFTDPASPILSEGVIEFDYLLTNLCMDDTDLYVTLRTGPSDCELRIYSYATDPLLPALEGSHALLYVVQNMELLEKPSWDTHIAISALTTVYTYNVEDPLAIDDTGSFTLGAGYIKDIYCVGGALGDHFLMCADIDYDGDGYLYVMQQTDIPGVIKLDDIDLPGSAEYASVKGDYAVIGDGAPGVSICDISTIGAPVYDSTLAIHGSAHEISIQGNIACVLPLDSGLHVLDVTDPSVPSITSRLQVANGPNAIITLSENKLLIAERAGTHYALEVIDITNPLSAFVTTEYDVAEPPEFYYLDGNMLIVSQEESALLFDVSDDTSLVLLGTIPFGATVATVGLHNDFAYVAKLPTGVKIYDVGTPSIPLYASSISTDFVVMDFTFYGEYMYVATGVGISIYNISNPYAVVEEIPYHVGEFTKESMILDDVLYLVASNLLETVDLTDPVVPVQLGQLEVEPVLNLTDVILEGDFAYVQGDGTVPYACSIWPIDAPANFGQIYSHDPYGGERDLYVWNGYLYEGSLTSGLRIFDLY